MAMCNGLHFIAKDDCIIIMYHSNPTFHLGIEMKYNLNVVYEYETISVKAIIYALSILTAIILSIKVQYSHNCLTKFRIP